jgi:hypothetical protein
MVLHREACMKIRLLIILALTMSLVIPAHIAFACNGGNGGNGNGGNGNGGDEVDGGRARPISAGDPTNMPANVHELPAEQVKALEEFTEKLNRLLPGQPIIVPRTIDDTPHNLQELSPEQLRALTEFMHESSRRLPGQPIPVPSKIDDTPEMHPMSKKGRWEYTYRKGPGHYPSNDPQENNEYIKWANKRKNDWEQSCRYYIWIVPTSVAVRWVLFEGTVMRLLSGIPMSFFY